MHSRRICYLFIFIQIKAHTRHGWAGLQRVFLLIIFIPRCGVNLSKLIRLKPKVKVKKKVIHIFFVGGMFLYGRVSIFFTYKFQQFE